MVNLGKYLNLSVEAKERNDTTSTSHPSLPKKKKKKLQVPSKHTWSTFSSKLQDPILHFNQNLNPSTFESWDQDYLHSPSSHTSFHLTLPCRHPQPLKLYLSLLTNTQERSLNLKIKELVKSVFLISSSFGFSIIHSFIHLLGNALCNRGGRIWEWFTKTYGRRSKRLVSPWSD